MFQKINYKFRCQVELNGSTTSVVTAANDAGAEINLIRDSFLPFNWLNAVRTKMKRLRFESTLKQALQINGMLFSYIKMRDNAARVLFSVIDRLAVVIRLGTSYIDRSNQYVIPMERRIVPGKSALVVIVFRINHDEYAAKV